MIFPLKQNTSKNQALQHWTCLLSMTSLENLRRAPLVLAAATGLAALFALVTWTEATEQVATRWRQMGRFQKIFIQTSDGQRNRFLYILL